MRHFIGLLLVLVFFSSQSQNTEFSRPDLPGEFMVDVGINVWSEVPDTLDRKGFASKSIGIYYAKRYKINNKLSFYPGIGLGLEKMGFKSSITFMDSLSFITRLPYTGITKNKLAITYLDVPVDFRFHPNGTQDGEGFFVGIGGIFGLRMSAHTKWKYDEGDGNKKLKETGKFNLNSIRYGYQVRVGFKGVHAFYKRYVSETFKSPIDGANPVTTTIGINFTGF